MPPSGAWLRARLEDRRVEIGLIGLCLLALTIFAVHGRYGDGDIRIYHRYAVEFWAGRHAFHQLPAEYPPLALVVFTLSVLPPLHDYATVFAIWMSAVFVAGYLAFIRFSTHRQAVIFFFLLIVGATSTLLARYDLIPALLTVAAVWATSRGRYNLAYLLLAAGILLKLYPVFLVPLVMIEQRRALLAEGRSWLRPVTAGASIAGGMVILGFGVAVALGGWSGLSPFFYAGARPLQVESLGASLLWLSSFVGFSAEVEHSFFSYNLIGPLAPGIASISSTAGAAGILWIYWRLWQGRMTLARAFLGVICLVLLSSKVFSPQYLIWALPFVALVEGVDTVWLLVCACTTLIYPVLYVSENIFGSAGPFPYSGTFLGMIAIRNAVLIIATVRVLSPRRAGARAEMAGREKTSLSSFGD
ncbi:MAG: DUF2029 domain-containing protein [Candidatus Dormibacteraeota bacterium]|nr:DUF2029 domain-containing protein [Candidatus Dormibacteraeota bacterium]